MSQALLLQLMVIPLLLQSIAGWVWLAAHVANRGGKVCVDALGIPDLVATYSLGLTLVMLAVLSFVGLKQNPALATRTPKPGEILQFPLLLLLLGLCIVGLLVFRRVSVTELIGWRRLPVWRAVLWGVGLMALAWPAIAMLSDLIAHSLPKGASEEQVLVAMFRNEVKQGHYAGIASIFAAAVIMAPIGEEFLFRGYFYAVGKRFFGASSSAVLTAVLFAFVHANIVSFAGLLILALCFTIAYERTGSLLVPISMHAVFNASNLALIFHQALQMKP